MTMQEKYVNGEFPECFKPCPPFYDFCNHMGSKGEKECAECINKNNFCDYLE